MQSCGKHGFSLSVYNWVRGAASSIGHTKESWVDTSPTSPQEGRFNLEVCYGKMLTLGLGWERTAQVHPTSLVMGWGTEGLQLESAPRSAGEVGRVLSGEKQSREGSGR